MSLSDRLSDAPLEYEREMVEMAKVSREGFGLLYDRYVTQVYRYCYGKTGSHEDAEDVTAETFRRALENIERYTWRGNPFGAWLYRIAANLIISEHRRSRPRESLDNALELADGDPLPEQVAVATDEASALWRMVRRLPHDQRRAVVLRFSHDMKVKDIAKAMDRSDAAVKQLLHRAMVTLRERASSGDGNE